MKRGRKSTAEVLTLHQGGIGDPPPPPIELSETEAALWRVIVATKPWDWFTPDTFPLLKEYCRASIQLDSIALRLKEVDKPQDSEQIHLFRALSGRQDKLRTSLKTLGASLRINLQSRYDAQKAGTRGRALPVRKPWERESAV